MLDKPSVANKNWARVAAVAATVAAASRGTSYLPATGAAFVHLLAYSTWLGAIVWTTFVAGIVMFKNLPRQMFGRVQSKLFPIYFGLSSACSAVQLGVLLFGAAAVPQKQLVLLGLGLASSLLSFLVVEPLCTRIMFQRYDLENAAERDEGTIKALAKQFGKWHGISSLINLATLVVAVGHGYWLAGEALGIMSLPVHAPSSEAASVCGAACLQRYRCAMLPLFCKLLQAAYWLAACSHDRLLTADS
jgi:hypothetical protein